MATQPKSKPKGSGLITFSGIMLIVAGGTRIIDGLWALKRDNDLEGFEDLENLLLFDDNLAIWGWFYLIVGIVLIAAGFGLFSGASWARWVGIIFSAIAIFMHFSWMYAFPVQALIGVVIDTIVLATLTTYGGTNEEF